MIRHPRPSPFWGSQAWRCATEQWARDQLAGLGLRACGPMIDVSDQAWSAVWRIPTHSGSVIVKQTTPTRRYEGKHIAFAAAVAPSQVDPPLAVDTTAGRILLVDRGPSLHDRNPRTHGLELGNVPALMIDYARLQQATIGHDQQARNRFRYIDFGDAAWTHPFLSLNMTIVECRYRWSVPDQDEGLNLDHPVLRRILDSYLSAWTDYAPLDALRETLRHALRISPLRRSSAWIGNLAYADDQNRTEHGAMPWIWLEDLTLPVLF